MPVSSLLASAADHAAQQVRPRHIYQKGTGQGTPAEQNGVAHRRGLVTVR